MAGTECLARDCPVAGWATVEEWVAADHEPTRSQFDQLCEDIIEVTFGAGIQDMKLQPESMGGRQRRARLGAVRAGSVGLTSRAMTLAVGINSCSNCSRFGIISAFKVATPVTLPPGRLKLATSPI